MNISYYGMNIIKSDIIRNTKVEKKGNIKESRKTHITLHYILCISKQASKQAMQSNNKSHNRKEEAIDFSLPLNFRKYKKNKKKMKSIKDVSSISYIEYYYSV